VAWIAVSVDRPDVSGSCGVRVTEISGIPDELMLLQGDHWDMSVLDRFSELRPPFSSADALVEADRCLDCAGPYAPAPCTAACPADVDVPGFIRELAAGDALDAARTIYRENLLGGTCARVCPVEVLCQGACVLAHEGQRPDRDRRTSKVRDG
jgi:hypothetical protein